VSRGGGIPVRWKALTVSSGGPQPGPALRVDGVDALLASTPVGVALFDADLRFDRVNDPFLAMLGADGGEVVGRALDDVPGVPPRITRWLRQALERGTPVPEREIAVPETGPPGTRRHFLVRCFPIVEPLAGVVGAGAVTLDITTRRHAEAAVGLVVAASDLFASPIGHDDLLEQVVKLAVPLFADGCVLHLRGGPSGTDRWLWSALDDSGVVQVGRGERTWAADVDVRAVVEDVLRTPGTRRLAGIAPDDGDVSAAAAPGGTRSTVRSLIAAPLATAGQVLGALTFITTTPGREYVRESELLADELARRCADAIQNARLTSAEAQARARLELLARVGELMTVELDSNARLDGTARLAIPNLADLCVIYLAQADGTARLASFAHVDRELESVFAGLSEWPALEPGSPAPPMRAIRENRPVLVTDVPGSELEQFLDDERKRAVAAANNVRSMLAVPLATHEGAFGAVAFAYAARNYVHEDIPLAMEIARRVAPAVGDAMRFEQEHAMAETLQRSLLPERLDEPDAIELVARYLPAAKGAKIGGDWYDVVALDADRTMVVIGDVLGHGIRAAASMSRLRTAFQVYALEGLTGPEILERLNAYATSANRHGAEPVMASILVAEHDARTNGLRFANAGHVPPCIRRLSGETTMVEVVPCTPIGAIEDARYGPTDATIDPGSVLLLYTDGLVERRHEPLDTSFERLLAELGRAPSDLGALADHVLAAMLGERANEDDVALIALRPRDVTAD
jgi:PAS domain S-box-containing protein